MILTNEGLQTACAEWQKRLRLQDWIVKVRVCRERDMVLQGCQGECEWRLSIKTAAIRILDPIDYPENLIVEQDVEKTLVHELLHLHFGALYANTEDASINDAQEQAIDCIASALIGLHRKKEDHHAS